MRRLVLAILIVLLLMPTVCAAQGVETQGLTQGLEDEVAEVLPEFDEQRPADFWESFKDIFASALSKLTGRFQSSVRICAVLVAVLALCAIAKITEASPMSKAIVVAGTLAITLTVIGDFQSMILLAEDTVRSMTDYSACLLPIMASATIMGGGIASASALYGGTVIFAQVLMQLITKILLPGVYFYIALAMAQAALDSDTLSELREFVGWLISKSLRIVMYIFIFYMSVTGVVGGAADAATIKATKAAISGMIPVVGNIVSDASESLLATAGLLKSSVGVFGMLAVIGICLLPFLRVGVHYLLLKVTAAVSATVGLKPHVQLVKHFSQAMGYLLAMCGACALLLLISAVCFIKVVV